MKNSLTVFVSNGPATTSDYDALGHRFLFLNLGYLRYEYCHRSVSQNGGVKFYFEPEQPLNVCRQAIIEVLREECADQETTHLVGVEFEYVERREEFLYATDQEVQEYRNKPRLHSIRGKTGGGN